MTEVRYEVCTAIKVKLWPSGLSCWVVMWKDTNVSQGHTVALTLP